MSKDIKYCVKCYTSHDAGGYGIYAHSKNSLRHEFDSSANYIGIADGRSFDASLHEEMIKRMLNEELCVVSFKPETEKLSVYNLSKKIIEHLDEIASARAGQIEIVQEYKRILEDVDYSPVNAIKYMEKHYFDVTIDEEKRIVLPKDDEEGYGTLENISTDELFPRSLDEDVLSFLKNSNHRDNFIKILKAFIFSYKNRRKFYILCEPENYEDAKMQLISLCNFFPAKVTFSFCTWYNEDKYDINIAFNYQKAGLSPSDTYVKLGTDMESPEENIPDNLGEYNYLNEIDDYDTEKIDLFIEKVIRHNDQFDDIDKFLRFVNLLISLSFKTFNPSNAGLYIKELVDVIGENITLIQKIFDGDYKYIVNKVLDTNVLSILTSNPSRADEELIAKLLELNKILEIDSNEINDAIYDIAIGENGYGLNNPALISSILKNNEYVETYLLSRFKSERNTYKDMVDNISEFFQNSTEIKLFINFLYRIIAEGATTPDSGCYCYLLMAIENKLEDGFKNFIPYLFNEDDQEIVFAKKVDFITEYIKKRDENIEEHYKEFISSYASLSYFRFIPFFDRISRMEDSDLLIKYLFIYYLAEEDFLKCEAGEESKAMRRLVDFIIKFSVATSGIDNPSILRKFYEKIRELYFDKSDFLRVIRKSDYYCYECEDVDFDGFMKGFANAFADDRFKSDILEAIEEKRKGFESYHESLSKTYDLSKKRVDFTINLILTLGDYQIKKLINKYIGSRKYKTDMSKNDIRLLFEEFLLKDLDGSLNEENKKVELALEVEKLANEKSPRVRSSIKEIKNFVLGLLLVLLVLLLVNAGMFFVVFFLVLKNSYALMVLIASAVDIILSIVLYCYNFGPSRRLFTSPVIKTIWQLTSLTAVMLISVTVMCLICLYA